MKTGKTEKKIFLKNRNIFYIFCIALAALVIGFKFGGLLSFGKNRLVVESNLTKENKKSVEELVKMSLKDEYVPKTIKLEEMPANATTTANLVTEYYASWEIGDEIFSLLYVIRNGEKKPDFIRLWALNLDDGVTREKSIDLFMRYFKESYVRMFEGIECAEIDDGVTPEVKAAECGQMKLSKPADLFGLTVKGPIPISEGFFGQSISACLIPDGALRGYPFKNCI